MWQLSCTLHRPIFFALLHVAPLTIFASAFGLSAHEPSEPPILPHMNPGLYCTYSTKHDNVNAAVRVRTPRLRPKRREARSDRARVGSTVLLAGTVHRAGQQKNTTLRGPA